MGDKWGVTHCAACGRPLAKDKEWQEYNVITERDGEEDAEAWAIAYCWYGTEDKCIQESPSGNVTDWLVMLRERIDELEAQYSKAIGSSGSYSDGIDRWYSEKVS